MRKKINTACCSCYALHHFEWSHLDVAAVSATASQHIDAGEILTVIQYLKAAAAVSQKARVVLVSEHGGISEDGSLEGGKALLV